MESTFWSTTTLWEQWRVVDLLQETGPRVRPAQALDRGELGLGMAFDFQGTLQQVRMVLLEPEDFGFFGSRAVEAGRFHWHRQTSSGDDLLAAFTVEAPVHERIPVGEVMLVQPLLAAQTLTFGRCRLCPR